MLFVHQDHTHYSNQSNQDIQYLLRAETKVFHDSIPKYFDLLFGNGLKPAWIENLHHRLCSQSQNADSWKDLDKLSSILGPESKLAKIIFSDCSTNLTLERGQLPLCINQIFNERKRAGLLNDCQTVFFKGKRTFDFKNMRINLSLEQWFLFILVNATVHESYVQGVSQSQSLDDFYSNLLTNPYFYLIRKYLVHFDNIGSQNSFKLLFILKLYTIEDYTIFLHNKKAYSPTPKQVVLDIIYFLIYYNRSNLNSQQMTIFFNHYLNPQNRGSQAFNASSLTRIWLFYIRPFDSCQSSVIRLILQTDQKSFQQKRRFLSLKRYPSQSILNSPTLNTEYYLTLRSSVQTNIQVLHFAVTSILAQRQCTYKSIYTLALLSCLFNPNLQSSIIRIIETASKKPYQFLKTKYYFEAKQSLTKVISQFQNYNIKQIQYEKEDMNNLAIHVYAENHTQIGQFSTLYQIQHYVDQQQTVISEIGSIKQKQLEIDPWSPSLCTHEITIFYYLALFLANLIDFFAYKKPFSTSPTINLRPMCNISIVLIIILTFVFVGIALF